MSLVESYYNCTNSAYTNFMNSIGVAQGERHHHFSVCMTGFCDFTYQPLPHISKITYVISCGTWSLLSVYGWVYLHMMHQSKMRMAVF